MTSKIRAARTGVSDTAVIDESLRRDLELDVLDEPLAPNGPFAIGTALEREPPMNARLKAGLRDQTLREIGDAA